MYGFQLPLLQLRRVLSPSTWTWRRTSVQNSISTYNLVPRSTSKAIELKLEHFKSQRNTSQRAALFDRPSDARQAPHFSTAVNSSIFQTPTFSLIWESNWKPTQSTFLKGINMQRKLKSIAVRNSRYNRDERQRLISKNTPTALGMASFATSAAIPMLIFCSQNKR